MKLTSREYERTFIRSEQGLETKKLLESMETDSGYITVGSYAPALGSDISFVDKHFTYLSLHQNVKPHEYISNLKLKTKVRR